MLADTELDKTILREAASGRPTAAAHFSAAVVVFCVDERILALEVVPLQPSRSPPPGEQVANSISSSPTGVAVASTSALYLFQSGSTGPK
jgi:hypothetical protein